MFKSILVSSDFSPASWKAFQVGISLKDKYGSKLYVVHIYPTEDDSDVSIELQKRMQKVKDSMDKMSAEYNGTNPSKGNGRSEIIENFVIPGNIEKALLKFIKDENFDLVIMGINGNGEDSIPGSHTSTVLEMSTSPVLVIPNNYKTND